MTFWIRYFAAQCLKDTVNNAKKDKKKLCVLKKRFMQKFRALKMANICQQDLKKNFERYFFYLWCLVY